MRVERKRGTWEEGNMTQEARIWASLRVTLYTIAIVLTIGMCQNMSDLLFLISLSSKGC